MSVIIVGGGIGGLSLALALARQGIGAVVLEQAGALDPVGAGLQLGPNATRILEGWGLGEALRQASVEPVRAEVRDAASGRTLVANRLGTEAQARWGGAYRTLSRAALQGLLAEAVAGEGLVDLRLARRVVSVRSESNRAVAVPDDGEPVEGEALFGCDGLHSVVRAAVAGPDPARYTGQTAWRGLARISEAGAPMVQVWTGPTRHVVRYPLGGNLVNLVAVVEAPQAEVESWTREGEAGELAAAFADWPEPVRAALAAVERPWRSALYDRPPLARWTAGRLALLGDAAHPMLPFLAQGAAMAIEDAEVAAQALASALAGDGDVAAALAAYAGARRARTAKVQAWSRRNARLFHLPSFAARGVFGAAGMLDAVRGMDGEARFDWLYGWRP